MNNDLFRPIHEILRHIKDETIHIVVGLSTILGGLIAATTLANVLATKVGVFIKNVDGTILPTLKKWFKKKTR